MCSPGTEIVCQGELTTTNCVPSSAPTFHDDQWVHAEVLMRGDQQVVHYINGKAVMEYGSSGSKRSFCR